MTCARVNFDTAESRMWGSRWWKVGAEDFGGRLKGSREQWKDGSWSVIGWNASHQRITLTAQWEVDPREVRLKARLRCCRSPPGETWYRSEQDCGLRILLPEKLPVAPSCACGPSALVPAPLMEMQHLILGLTSLKPYVLWERSVTPSHRWHIIFVLISMLTLFVEVFQVRWGRSCWRVQVLDAWKAGSIFESGHLPLHVVGKPTC